MALVFRDHFGFLKMNILVRPISPYCIAAALAFSSSVVSAQDLRQAVLIALNQYPTILAAQSKLDAAGSDITRAQGAHWPQVAWVGTQNAYNSGNVTNNWIQSPSISLNVWSGWKIQADVERTQALAEAGRSQQRITRDDVALLATEGYLNWARALDLLKLARDNMLAHARIRDDIKKIVDVDQGRRIDLDQAQVRFENAKLSVEQRESDLTAATQRLNRMLLGQMPSHPTGVDFEPGVAPASSKIAVNLLDDSHPVISQQIALVDAARAAVRSARSEFSPNVNVTYTKQTYQGTGQGDYLAQLVVSIPIFSGGASYGGVSSAQSNLEAAEFNVQETRLILRERLVSTWAEWVSAKERKTMSAKQIKIGQDIVEGYWKQFLVGRRSLLDLLNVLGDLYSYETANTGAKFDALISRARIMSLTGKLANAYQSAGVPPKVTTVSTINVSDTAVKPASVPKPVVSVTTTNILTEGGMVQTSPINLTEPPK